MQRGSAFNRDKLLKLLGLFDEALTELMAMRNLDREQLISSRDRYAMEQLFYRIGMVSIDICFHIASALSMRVPDTYRDCFVVLMEAGVIEGDLGRRMEELAGLRNFIAHIYWDIDYGMLYDFLERLEPLEGFREAVLAFLEKVNGKNG